MISIVIPTYNNINYLKLCLHSINKNSKYSHDIRLHINDGSDGTLDYAIKNKIFYTHSVDNIGLCSSINKISSTTNNKYLLYAHDDMYFCPNWDVVFFNELQNLPENSDFFLSGTMIQPFESYINLDCGDTIDNFDEEKLLSELPKIRFDDFQGTHWQPSLIPLKTWNKVGGFSAEFSPGLGSDPDFNMKLWNIGVRMFKGLGNCRVYHFSSLTLRKKAWNNGAKIFLLKWGISIKFFKKYYLRTDTSFNGRLTEPNKNFFYFLDLAKCKLTYFFHSIIS